MIPVWVFCTVVGLLLGIITAQCVTHKEPDDEHEDDTEDEHEKSFWIGR